MTQQEQQISAESGGSERPFYLFIHVPKNAGTTLRSIVDFQHGIKNTITYYNQKSTQLLENLDAMLKVGQHDYQALIGHFKYGVHKGLSCDYRYVTFLRDPVARAISSYYERRKTETSHFSKPDGSLLTLAESLVLHRNSYDNQQLRFLVGKAEDDQLSMDDVEFAIDILERDFLFAGLVELFDQSILLLSKQIGWKPCSYRPLNQGSDHDIDDADIKTIAALNEFDRILVEHVREKIAAETQKYGALFQGAFEEWMSARRTMEAGGGPVPVVEVGADELPRVSKFLLA
ncbi:MAG: sulfotransferase family 2 domain-containing protein [Rhodospirillaceae bacterium]|nr:sulfotransferase family 2 domain-containing protein [Rhodospirillaceae bacterium]MBT4720775.1 sulfotransferase family 2 domain-containing protein [Rhodospirillaceae bacterium]MBT4748853.1 sulfotransferase family 2 domain-containing protein [Rhodospirillaceae bacterium]MBT5177475.1 sulfotransferase family 2 domain-containing protein [Rhodospirillaceae bacterium]MBT5838551.1 sulfotransferase family 2 domain-containing protein [Rhodospirillaceae bacterium]